MPPAYVPRVLAADHTSDGAIITFDDNSATLFPAALLYETMVLHKLFRFPETPEESDQARP
jgi:hypothetical protein